MASFREFRDPVHGFIRVEGRERDVVDTALFQRLRRIRQLAMAHLVYPGAMHTRFEHSLGVLHVAGRLCSRLNIDRHHTDTIRMAALLHDVGHGPFSHVSEEVLATFAGPGSPPREIEKVHEVITRDIILSNTELGRYVAPSAREDIVKLLDSGLDQPVYHDIVSGALDADKQDYLLRDSLHCGVRYGLYDIDRLQAVLTTVRDERGDALAVDDDGVNTMEQFVLARYYITTQVVRHKVRLISDAMLVRGLTLGVSEDKLDFLIKLYSYKPGEAFVEEYLRWNDERLVSRLLEDDLESTLVGSFMRRLVERRLFKVMCRHPVADVPSLALDVSRFKSITPVLEAEIAELLSTKTGVTVSPHEVILKIQKSPPTRKSEGSVLIKSDGGQPQQFEERSLIFKKVDESLREEHLECYAPLSEKDEQNRRRIKSEVSELVLKRVSELLAAERPETASKAEGQDVN